MKCEAINIDWQNRRFIRNIWYGPEDGLPEGYSLLLEETAHPEDSTFYKNGDWGSWGYSPDTLTLIYHKWDANEKLDETIELENAESNTLYWLDIYDGIIVYASTGRYRNKNMVLYNVLTRQKLVIDDTFIPKDDEYDHFRDPKLWVHNNVIYVQFEAVDGWYDGGESCGSRIFCFEKDTLKQLEFKDTDNSGPDVWEAIENRGEELKCANGPVKRFYHANLFPDYFHNRYHVKGITSIVHEVEHKEHRYKDCPMSLIKQMRKVRLEYAKENGLEITPYNIRPWHKTIWHKLGKFFERLGDKVDRRRDKRLDKIRKKYQK